MEPRIGDSGVGGSSPAMFALTVSDFNGPDRAAARLVDIRRRTEGLPSFGAICISNDSGSVDAFSDVCGIMAVLWDGPVVLRSDSTEALARGTLHFSGRDPLLSGGDAVSTAALASAFGCPMAVSVDDITLLPDFPDVPLVIATSPGSMKACLETNTSIRRGPLADIPIMTAGIPPGEYGVSMATVSLMSGGDLIVLEDMDRRSCEILDSAAAGAFRGWVR